MKLDSRQRELLLLLAWVALQYGQAGRAVDLLNLLLELQTDAIEARRMLVVALLQAGDGGGALGHCAELRRGGDCDATLWFCQSQAYQLSGRPDAARKAFEHYLKQKSTDEQVV